jgi:hypothetical protein
MADMLISILQINPKKEKHHGYKEKEKNSKEEVVKI